jgi:hypothetical protein
MSHKLVCRKKRSLPTRIKLVPRFAKITPVHHRIRGVPRERVPVRRGSGMVIGSSDLFSHNYHTQASSFLRRISAGNSPHGVGPQSPELLYEIALCETSKRRLQWPTPSNCLAMPWAWQDHDLQMDGTEKGALPHSARLAPTLRLLSRQAETRTTE